MSAEALYQKQIDSDYVTGGAVHVISNGIVELVVEDSTCEYTMRTGPNHPIPNEQILFFLGTSHDSVKSDVSGVVYTNTFSDPSGGAETVIPLSSFFPPVFSEDADSFTCTWNVVNNPDFLTIRKTGQVVGTSVSDSSIRIATTVINNGQEDALIQQRYHWDYLLNGDDGPDFTPQGPPGATTVLESDFVPPGFGFFLLRDNDAGSGLAVASDWGPGLFRLVYGDWPSMDGTAFDYISSPGTNVDGDSAVHFNFGDGSPFMIPPGGAFPVLAAQGGNPNTPLLNKGVGGEYFALDTIALLLVGVQTSFAWMIPVVLSAVGISLVLVRRK